jgi:hypothetical protein
VVNKNKIIAVCLRRRKIATVACCDMILIKTLYIKHINPVRLKSSDPAAGVSKISNIMKKHRSVFERGGNFSSA